MRAMPRDSAFSLSRTKLYDSADSFGSRAAISSTSRRTCSDSGSARAWEKTTSRTGFTSFVNSSLSCAAVSSSIRPMVDPQQYSRCLEDLGASPHSRLDGCVYATPERFEPAREQEVGRLGHDDRHQIAPGIVEPGRAEAAIPTVATRHA